MSVSGMSGFGNSFLVNANNTSATISNTQQPGQFASLNLTPAQQQQIDKILQNAQSEGLSPMQVQSQINGVLTPTQQQQLQSQLGQRHHHHHQGGSGGASAIAGDETDSFGIPLSISSGTSSATQTIGNIAASFWAQSQQQNGNNG